MTHFHAEDITFRDVELFVEFYPGEDIELHKIFVYNSCLRCEITNMFQGDLEKELIRCIEEQVYKCNLDEFDRS